MDYQNFKAGKIPAVSQAELTAAMLMAKGVVVSDEVPMKVGGSADAKWHLLAGPYKLGGPGCEWHLLEGVLRDAEQAGTDLCFTWTTPERSEFHVWRSSHAYRDGHWQKTWLDQDEKEAQEAKQNSRLVKMVVSRPRRAAA